MYSILVLYMLVIIDLIIVTNAVPSGRIPRVSESQIVSAWEKRQPVQMKSPANEQQAATLQEGSNPDWTKTYAPVPDIGKSPDPLPGKSYYIGKAATDVYWVNKNGYNSMVIVTNCGIVVVDAPTFIGQDLMTAIKEISNLPVTHLIYSHSHIDHIGDASPMFDKAIKVGHMETAKILKQRKDPKRPVPTSTFSGDTMTLQTGGKTIRLDYKGPIHSPGNIFVWLPNEKILFTCDVINPGWAPFTRLAVAEDAVAYLESPDVILSYPFQSIIAGHWGKLGTRQDVLNMKEYLRDVQQNAVTAGNAVNFTAIAMTVKDPSNIGLIAELMFKAQTDKCTELTLPKWLSRLGGVDIYTNSNCDAISMAQDIDYGRKVIG